MSVAMSVFWEALCDEDTTYVEFFFTVASKVSLNVDTLQPCLYGALGRSSELETHPGIASY